MLTALRRSYEEAYATDPAAPLYGAPWWLDATCDVDGWEIMNSAGQPSLMIPYHRTRIRGMRAYVNPPLTQWLPVVHNTSESSQAITALLHTLTGASVIDIAIKPLAGVALTDIQLPVHIKYTYLIHAGQSMEQVRSKYNEGLRRNIKASRQYYTIELSEDIETFIAVCRMTYTQRKMKMPPWFQIVISRVFEGIRKHQCGSLTFALRDGKPVAGVMIGHDHSRSYYLAGGRTADEGGSSAHALLLDEAVAKSVEAGSDFDFEGSMQPGIANFFQSFGAVPSPYWHIRKLTGMARIWGVLHP